MLSKRDVLTGGSALIATGLWAGSVQAAVKPMVVAIPITISSDSKPVLSLTIGGKGPYNFILDTGAYSPIMRESLAKELGLHQAGYVKSLSLKGDDTSYIYKAENILIGGRLPMTKMSFVGVATFPGHADGVLPVSFLTFLPSQLDYEAKEIRYYIGGAEMDLTGFEKVPAFFQAEREDSAEYVYVELNFDGRKLVCALDTGAAGNLFVYSGIVDRYKLWDKYPVIREGRSVGANGQSLRTRLVQGPNISFGGLRMPVMPVTLGDPQEYEKLSGLHDGLLGAAFLRHFIVAFGADKALYLKPNSSFPQLSNFLPDSIVPDAPVSSPDAPQVPFLYGDDRKIIVPGRVGEGQAFTCIVNTGVATSEVGVKRAADLGLSKLATGEFDASLITFSTIRLPKLKLAANAKVPNANPRLGVDFLTQLPVGIDFDANRLTFFIKTAPDITGYVQLPGGRGADGRYQVKATLAGRPVNCLIDTATQMAVLLPAATTRAWNLWNAFPDAENRMAGGDSGTVKTRYVKMKGLDLGGLHIETAPVTMVQPDAPADPDVAGFDAVIGMGVIHRLNLVFAADGTIWVKPNSFWTDAKPSGQSPLPGASVPPPVS